MGKNNRAKINTEEGAIIDDPRFLKVHYDPKFKKISSKASKVRIDPRFSGPLKSKEFLEDGSKAIVDKYGRPQRPCTSKEKLDRYYRLDPSDEETSDRDDHHLGEKPRDLARGIGMESSSEEESDNSDCGGEDLFQYGPFEECETVPIDHVTRRLAITDLDWDNIEAASIYRILASFVPSGGSLHSVKIYTSEFGEKRLKEENLNGPPKDIFLPVKEEPPTEDGEESMRFFEDDDAEAFDQVKLRKYLLERLRYYYCVAEFDSAETARVVYRECNGLEIEHSSNILDLRYIPDSMVFEGDPVGCFTKDSVQVFEKVDFVTDSMQLSKPKLAWDEDVNNVRIIKRRFTDDELERMDLKTYLASPTASDYSVDEEGNPDRGNEVSKKERIREKYMKLIAESDGDRNVYQKQRKNDIDVKFNPVIDMQCAKLDGNGPDPSGNENFGGSDSGVSSATEEEDASAQNEPDDPHYTTLGSGAPSAKLHSKQLSDIPGSKLDSVTNNTKGKNRISREERMAMKKQKDDLELLMMDDDPHIEASDLREEFSAKQVIRYEKMLRSSGKLREKRRKKTDVSEVQSSFKIDTADVRFSNFYKDADFAIDPTCPLYKPTTSISALLTERKKFSNNATNEARNTNTTTFIDQAEGTPVSICSDTQANKLVQSLKRKPITPKKRKCLPLYEVAQKFNNGKKNTISI